MALVSYPEGADTAAINAAYMASSEMAADIEIDIRSADERAVGLSGGAMTVRLERRRPGDA